MLNVIAGRVQAVTNTLTAVTTFSGEATGTPLTMLTGKGTPRIRFFGEGITGSTGSSAARVRIRSPDMHDSAIGIDVGLSTSTTGARDMSWVLSQQALKAATVLTWELTGGTAGSETGFGLIGNQYDPVSAGGAPGTPDYVGRQVATTAGNVTSSTAWGATVAIANLKSNKQYYLLGYTVDTNCLAVRFQSPDFNGLFPGGPGYNPTLSAGTAGALHNFYSQWFVTVGDVPSFNSNSGLSVQTEDAAAATVNVYCYLATAK